MVEAGASEIPEAEILDALDIAHGEIKKLCALQRELREKAGKEKAAVEAPAGRRGALRADQGRAWAPSSTGPPGRGQARAPGRDQGRRGAGARAVRRGGRAARGRRRRRAPRRVQLAFDKLEKAIIRERIAVQKERPDGRAADEIRPISIEVGVAPRTHGSALFTRGQTQALSVVALGTHARGDAARHARARDLEALLPPLQLPALLGRGGRLHARAEAPRHRPRRARRAGARADDPVAGGVPVHDPRGLGHPRVQRLVLDGVASAARRCR